MEVGDGRRERGSSTGVVDLLIAATAELHRLVLLHDDPELERVGGVTSQPTQWLAEPGSLR